MANTPKPATRKRGGKGPRSKHLPQRTCISCREKGDKRGLIRIVRTPDHAVEVDPTGKRNGRGAYLCHRRECWDRALAGSALNRALNTEITKETQEELGKFAAALDNGMSDRMAATS